MTLGQAHTLLYFSAEIIARQTLLRYMATASGKRDSELQAVKDDIRQELELLLKHKGEVVALLQKKFGTTDDGDESVGAEGE